jgi:hypothetical protein
MMNDWELWEEENCWAAESEWRAREFQEHWAETIRKVKRRMKGDDE